MTGFEILSRRGLLRLFAALATGAARAEVLAGTSHLRHYRVRAVITLLGVPIFTKDNVGGACAMNEQSADGVSIIQFVSGSWPEKLKGFNRFGMVQEIVREQAGAVTESTYLSYMTSSAEKNLDQARKSFSEQKASQSLSVAHGRAKPTSYASALDHLTVPSKYTWLDCPRLTAEIKDKLSPLNEAVADANQGAAYQPFLHTVRKAFESKLSEQIFMHNAKLYRLRTKISSVPEGLLMVAKIAEPGSNQESEFKVWYDPRDGSGLPLRFEFRPKSFLHLVFEQDPAVKGPQSSSLIAQEQA